MIIHPALRRPLVAVALAATVWAMVTLFGGTGLVSVSGVLGVILVRAGRGRELTAADRAIITATDPGPDGREAADSRALSVLTRPRSEDWAVFVVLVATGIACLVAAVVRDEAWAAVPGALLLALAPVLWLLDRRGLLAASRWLDSPPFDRQQPA